MTSPSWAGLVAATIAVLMGGVLVAILASEGDSSVFGVTVIGAAGAAAVAGSLSRRPALRVGCLWAAAGILAGIGTLGIFSVGLPLLVAAAFAVGGIVEPARALGRPWLVAAAALSVPAAGVLAVALYVLAR